MFIIPCKYTSKSTHIVQLVSSIRLYHPSEKIMVVDSNSEDKSYFTEIEKYNVIVEDIKNPHWMVGAYWHGYFRFPNEPFYYFIHDSTKVKANMSYLTESPLTILSTFNRNASDTFDAWNDKINSETKYKVKYGGKGVFGPMMMCQNNVITTMYNKGASILLPSTKAETGYMEGAFGAMLEADGYDMDRCSLFGDILVQLAPGGKSHGYNTSWQHPIEKFFAAPSDEGRR